MKTNADNNYDKIFNELKEEKMNWDFEDFLAKTEENSPIIPLKPKSSGGSISKFYWMAASLLLLVSLGIFIKFFNNEISQKDQLVKNEIIKQKSDFGKGNEIVAIHSNDSLNIVSDSLVSDTVSSNVETNVLDKILPKRGRLKKISRPQYVHQSNTEKSAPTKTIQTPDYESNYVIINGQKIENEQEAIDLTKYSFRILSENVSQTVAKTEAMTNLNTD